MCFIIIGGYVVASSPPVARIIEMLAQLLRSGRGGVAFVAPSTSKGRPRKSAELVRSKRKSAAKSSRRIKDARGAPSRRSR
jgi:hypothetical protein